MKKSSKTLTPSAGISAGRNWSRIPILAVLALPALLLGSPALADSTWTGSSSQDWNNPANWSSSPANPSGSFFIDLASGNYSILNADSAFSPVDIIIGGGSGINGRLDQRAGALATGVGNWFFVGRSTGTGTYNLADTSTSGTGVSGFAQGSGSVTVGKLWLAGATWSDNGVGTVNINTTGTVLANSSDGGVAGANIIVANAWYGSATGTINLENGTVTSTMELWVGRAGTGVFNQSGGTNNSAAWFVIGRESPGGYSAGNGTYNLSGGVVNAATGWGFPTLGSFSGAQGTLNVSGGTFNAANNSPMYVGEGGTGILTVTNTGLVVVNNTTDGLMLGRNGGSIGTVNLNGGTILAALVKGGSGSSTFDFNGGTLKPAQSTPTFMQSLGSALVQSGGAVFDTAGFDIAVPQYLQGSGGDGGLTKLGNGKLTLASAYYTGPTRALGGTLAVTPSLSSLNALTVSNATLELDNLGTLNGTSATFKGASVLNLNYGTIYGGAAATALNLSGGTVANTGTVTINITAMGLAAGTNVLIYTGSSLPTNGFVLGSLPAGVTAYLANSGQSLDLVITLAIHTLTWYGAEYDPSTYTYTLNTNWDIGSSTNWYDVFKYSYDADYLEYPGPTGDAVAFNDSIYSSDATSVNLTTTLSPVTLLVNAGSYNYNFSGPGSIAGGVMLVKSNTGSLFLGMTNSYSGGTLVAGGTVSVFGDQALGVSNGVVTLSGGALQFAGDTAGTRPIALAAAGTVGVSPGVTARVDGPISGPFSLTKVDNGTLTLSATNTYSGNTFVKAGALVVSSGAIISNTTWDSIGQSGTDIGALTLEGSGSFITTGDFNVGDIDSSVGTLNVQDSATLTVHDFFVGSANATGSTASGRVNQTGGSVTQTDTGVGAFAIGGRTSASGFGVYNLSGGTLTANAGIRVGGTGTGVLNQIGGHLLARQGINVARIAGSTGTNNLNGGTLETWNVASSTGINSVFNFNGGTLLPTTNNSSFFQGLTRANVRDGGAVIDSGPFAITIAQPLLRSDLSGDAGTGGLIKLGAGTLTLTGANTYTGTTMLSNGTLYITPLQQAPTPVVVADGATLGLLTSPTNIGATIGNLTLGATGTAELTVSYLAAGDPTNVALTAAAVTVNGSSFIRLNGAFHTGAFPLLKYSSVTTPLPALVTPRGTSATLSNDTIHTTLYVVVASVGDGLVWTGNTGLLPNLWDISLTTNWLAGLAPATYTETFPPGDAVLFNDSGSGTVLVSNTLSPAHVTISNSAVAYMFQGSGQVNSGLGLTKLGSGTVTLNLPGSYFGSTVVSNGVLNLGVNQTFANLTGNGVLGSASGAPTLTAYNDADSIFSGTLQGALNLTKTGQAALTLNGSGTSTSGALSVNAGSVNFAGGTAAFGSTLTSYVGYLTGNGTLNVTGGALGIGGELKVGGSDQNGSAYNAVGTLTVSNATLLVGALTVARGNYLDNSVSGTVTLQSGGVLISTNDVVLQFAGSGRGKLALNGGTFVLGPTGTRWFIIGFYDSGAGELDITNGNLFLENGSSLKLCHSGNTGANIVNQVGGNVTFYSDAGVTVGGGGNLDLNYAGGSSSTSAYNLQGGTLTVPQIIASSGSGSGVFVFNGGTLAAAASSTAFMQGLTAAYVKGGGAIIDTGTNSISIAQALRNTGFDADGGLTKFGNGTLLLNGLNTYTNTTTVAAGTLGGVGTIAGALTVNSGAGLAPGASIGTLSVNGTIRLNAGSTNVFEVNGSTSACDLVVAGGSVTYGGVLKIVPSGTFTNGQQFVLFSGSGAVSASNFSSLQGSAGPGLAFTFTNGVLSVGAVVTGPTLTSVTPSSVVGSSFPVSLVLGGSGFDPACSVLLTNLTSATGASYTPAFNSSSSLTVSFVPGTTACAWNATVVNPGPAASGQVSFSVTAPPTPAIASGNLRAAGPGKLVLSGTGGTPNYSYVVLSATNLVAPVAWSRVATNQFDGSGGFNYTNAVDTAPQQLFLRLEE